MNDLYIFRKYSAVAVLLVTLLGVAMQACADPHDPEIPGPKPRGAAEGLGVGSLISTAVMATPKRDDNSGGDMLVWGYRWSGQHGNYDYNGHDLGTEYNSPSDRKNYPRLETVKAFKQSPDLKDKEVIRIFTTAYSLHALTRDGELWSWGYNNYGQVGCVGTGYETDPLRQAKPCPTFGKKNPNKAFQKKVVYVDGGEYNVIVITEDGGVYSWGWNNFSQITSGAGGIQKTPFNITNYFKDKDGDRETVVLVGGAYESQYALSVDKKGKYSVWGWGRNHTQAIRTSTANVTTPYRMTQYDNIAKEIVYINGGYGFVMALLADGRIFASGSPGYIGMNAQGSAGYDGQMRFLPVQIMGAGTSYPAAVKLITRYQGGVAVPADDPKALYTWGRSYDGAYKQVYGYYPTKRVLKGNLKSVGATKETVIYLTEANELYGVGYGDQRVINLCDNNNVSWDKERGRYVDKNSMNWPGYRIPYEERTDVVGVDYCDGTFGSGYYSGKSRQDVRKWTGYNDGRDGPVPSDGGALLCQTPDC